MEPKDSWVALLDCYVDPGRSDADHNAACSSMVSILKQGSVSIANVISEMGAYLTTTDNLVRSRGMLFLAEIVSALQTVSLEDTVVHFLAEFFTARFADWSAFRGAVAGALALLKRNKLMSNEDVEKMTMSIVQNFDVQGLKQNDRMLCFEVYDCLLDKYASIISHLGDVLVRGVCEAIEGERDPRCLLMCFRIVEHLGKQYPTKDGPLSKCAADVFEIVSSYFPISFNPRQKDNHDITREDLVISLQRALASSPFFASECFKLLLEKLSSSLQEAKLDSLRCLGYCAATFDTRAISGFARPIWAGLRCELFPTLTSSGGDFGNLQRRDTRVFNATIKCLSQCVKAFESTNLDKGGELLQAVLEDEMIQNYLISTRDSTRKCDDQLLKTCAQVLAASARASCSSSYIIMKEVVGWSRTGITDATSLQTLVRILQAVRDVAHEQASGSRSMSSNWLLPLREHAKDLIAMFHSACRNESDEQAAVSGLQTLATFPGPISAISEAETREVISILTSLYFEDSKQVGIWEKALDALVDISDVEEKFWAAENANVVVNVVVPQLLEALFETKRNDFKKLLHAVAALSRARPSVRDIFLERLGEAIDFPYLLTTEHSGKLVAILNCIAEQLLPRCDGGPGLKLPLKIWCWVNSLPSHVDVGVEVVIALVEIIRVAVQKSNQEEQEIVLTKAVEQLSDRGMDKSPQSLDVIVPLFCSVVVAMRPGFLVMESMEVVDLFLRSALVVRNPEMGDLAGQAVASLLNKWSNAEKFDSVVDYVINTAHAFVEEGKVRACRMVVTMAWICKGLALKGHDVKVTEIAMELLRVVETGKLKNELVENGDKQEGDEIRMAAVEGFGIIVRDETKCLNKDHYAFVRPLYKQKFFASMLAPLRQAIEISSSRIWLLTAFSRLLQGIPQAAMLSEADKVLPMLLETLSFHPKDASLLHSNVLLLSTFVMDASDGHGVAVNYVKAIVTRLLPLLEYSASMAVRESAVDCIGAIVALPYPLIYPLRTEVLRGVSRALDDRKRQVRIQSVRCYQAWRSITPR